MGGDDARFCGICRKVVHDSRALDTCELQRLVDAGGACVRVWRDLSNRVVTRDRLAAAALALAACRTEPHALPDAFAPTADAVEAATASIVEAETASSFLMGDVY